MWQGQFWDGNFEFCAEDGFTRREAGDRRRNCEVPEIAHTWEASA